MIGKLNEKKALSLLMEFLSIEGITGKEKLIAKAVEHSLISFGVPKKFIFFDNVKNKIPLSTETGNLIVKLPGTIKGHRRLFMTHLDTVPLCSGAVPIKKNNKIVSQNNTALGGDNRTGVACLVNMLIHLLKNKLPHYPLTILFTVREESGLWGARYVNKKDLGNPIYGYNIDGMSPKILTIGAVGADRWQVKLFGKAAHAGVEPEKGISASIVASLALSEIYKKKWFGKINKNGNIGTSNIGSISGEDYLSAGNATNVVTDFVKVTGESRSKNIKFISDITKAYRTEFYKASKIVRNNLGKFSKIKFHSEREYFPFLLKKNNYVIKNSISVAKSLGWTSKLEFSHGGLDANWTVRHGIPTITFGAGQNKIHTKEEFIKINDYLSACRYAIALATKI